MQHSLTTQRLIALFFCGLLLLNFPLLGLWDTDLLVVGVPLLPLALFVLWALLIFVLAWLMEHSTVGEQDLS